MPLASRNGPPNTGSTSQVSITPEPPPAEVRLDQTPYIKDSFVNRTAFNPQTYAEEFGLLQRYTAGSRIRVTYFLRSTPTAGLQRADAIDPSSVRSPLQTNYTEIRELEIVVQDRGLQSTFNAESRESKVHGAALLYPGMRPTIGDLFITPIGDATFGIFQVSEVSRLSYRQGSNHRIGFFLREFASDEVVQIVRRSVTKTLWFEKETYLGDATTLLTEESFRYRKQLLQMRGVLIRHYYNTFHSQSLGSIVSPNGIYDPYLVEYLTRKISIRDSIQRAVQLYPAMENYDNSLWARLTDHTNRTLFGLQPNYTLQRVGFTRWDIAITSLINHVVVTLENPNKQAMEGSTPTVAPSSQTAGLATEVMTLTLTGASSNGFYVTLPPGSILLAVQFAETLGQNVTLSLGTTPTGVDVLGAGFVAANTVVKMLGTSLDQYGFSTEQKLYVSSSNWNNASIDMKVWYVT